jgi:hypothetical protein
MARGHERPAVACGHDARDERQSRPDWASSGDPRSIVTMSDPCRSTRQKRGIDGNRPNVATDTGVRNNCAPFTLLEV